MTPSEKDASLAILDASISSAGSISADKVLNELYKASFPHTREAIKALIELGFAYGAAYGIQVACEEFRKDLYGTGQGKAVEGTSRTPRPGDPLGDSTPPTLGRGG